MTKTQLPDSALDSVIMCEIIKDLDASVPTLIKRINREVNEYEYNKVDLDYRIKNIRTEVKTWY